jgi:hypothetical protein
LAWIEKEREREQANKQFVLENKSRLNTWTRIYLEDFAKTKKKMKQVFG